MGQSHRSFKVMTSPAQPMRLADHLPHVTSMFTAHYRSLPCCFHCARVIPAANRSKRRRAKPSESADGSLITPPPVYKLKPRPKSTQKEVTVYTNLRDVIGVHTGGPSGRRKSDKIGHSEATYIQFLDLGNTGCCCVTVCCVSVTECVCCSGENAGLRPSDPHQADASFEPSLFT